MIRFTLLHSPASHGCSRIVSPKTEKSIGSLENQVAPVKNRGTITWEQYEQENNKVKAVAEKIYNTLTIMYLRATEPDLYLYSSLAYLSLLIPRAFSSKEVVDHLCRMLYSEPRIDSKEPDASEQLTAQQNPFRKNPSIPVLCCGLLFNAHKDMAEWPLLFIQCYMEDAFNSRIWVDHEACRLFVLNLLTSLPPSRAISTPCTLAMMSRAIAGIPPQAAIVEISGDEFVRDRWPKQQKERIIPFVIQMLEFHESKRNENIVNFIKTLCTISSVGEARTLGSRYLGGRSCHQMSGWIHSNTVGCLQNGWMIWLSLGMRRIICVDFALKPMKIR